MVSYINDTSEGCRCNDDSAQIYLPVRAASMSPLRQSTNSVNRKRRNSEIMDYQKINFGRSTNTDIMVSEILFHLSKLDFAALASEYVGIKPVAHRCPSITASPIFRNRAVSPIPARLSHEDSTDGDTNETDIARIHEPLSIQIPRSSANIIDTNRYIQQVGTKNTDCHENVHAQPCNMLEADPHTNGAFANKSIVPSTSTTASSKSKGSLNAPSEITGPPSLTSAPVSALSSNTITVANSRQMEQARCVQEDDQNLSASVLSDSSDSIQLIGQVVCSNRNSSQQLSSVGHKIIYRSIRLRRKTYKSSFYGKWSHQLMRRLQDKFGYGLDNLKYLKSVFVKTRIPLLQRLSDAEIEEIRDTLGPALATELIGQTLITTEKEVVRPEFDLAVYEPVGSQEIAESRANNGQCRPPFAITDYSNGNSFQAQEVVPGDCITPSTGINNDSHFVLGQGSSHQPNTGQAGSNSDKQTPGNSENFADQVMQLLTTENDSNVNTAVLEMFQSFDNFTDILQWMAAKGSNILSVVLLALVTKHVPPEVMTSLHSMISNASVMVQKEGEQTKVKESEPTNLDVPTSTKPSNARKRLRSCSSAGSEGSKTE